MVRAAAVVGGAVVVVGSVGKGTFGTIRVNCVGAEVIRRGLQKWTVI